MKNHENNDNGVHRHKYVPSLRGNNPEKVKKYDWWDEMCKTYGEKNYFPTKKTKQESDEDKKDK